MSIHKNTKIFSVLGRFARGVALACGLLTAAGAQADESERWSSTNLQVLYGTNFKLGPSTRTILTLEHASGWEYGDNFFFVDVTSFEDEGTELYGELLSRLSLSKISGRRIGIGPLSDVLLAGHLEFGHSVGDIESRTYLYGIGTNWDIPGFAFFNLNFFVRDDANIDASPTWQITTSWLVPFHVGAVKASFGGFVDFAGGQGDEEKSIVGAPQLLVDVGNFWGVPDRLHAGIEYQFWRNKFGIDGIDEDVVQAMVKWVL